PGDTERGPQERDEREEGRGMIEGAAASDAVARQTERTEQARTDRAPDRADPPASRGAWVVAAATGLALVLLGGPARSEGPAASNPAPPQPAVSPSTAGSAATGTSGKA